MGVTFSSTLRKDLRRMDQRLQAKVTEIVANQAAVGEASMKINAPWTDRTGAARTTLTANAHSTKKSHQIVFAHGVTYGIYLEVANGGKYQIIMPTVRLVGDQLQRELDGLLGKAGR